VFGHSYGTPRQPIETAIGAGRDIVTDIDWQGTQQLSKSVPQHLVTIFVLPPSHAALEARLRTRAQDSADVVAARMAKAQEEMSHWVEYDYVIVNDDLQMSVGQAEAIVTDERARRGRAIQDQLATQKAISIAAPLRRTAQPELSNFVDRLRAA
jgi:guanylate kinase